MANKLSFPIIGKSLTVRGRSNVLSTCRKFSFTVKSSVLLTSWGVHIHAGLTRKPSKACLGILPLWAIKGKRLISCVLWESRAATEFDLQMFNDGGYAEAVQEKAMGKRFQKSFTPMIILRVEKNSVWCSSTSLSPVRSKTSLRAFKKTQSDWSKFP